MFKSIFKKLFVWLLVVLVFSIMSFEVAFAQQPSGNVNITDVEYLPEIVISAPSGVLIKANATFNHDTLSISNSSSETYTAEMRLEWVVGIDATGTPPLDFTLNFSMPSSDIVCPDNSSLFYTNDTIINVTAVLGYTGDTLQVNITSGTNSTTSDVKLGITCRWDITILDLGITQVTDIMFDKDNTSFDVTYKQSYNISSPFDHNVTIQSLLPDTVNITDVVVNDTSITTATNLNTLANNTTFTITAEADLSGNPLVEITFVAPKIITMTVNDYKAQQSAVIGQDVEWLSNYTVDYNSSAYSNLLVENIALNHTLYPDSTITSDDITITGVTNSSPYTIVSQSYVKIDFNTFNPGNSSNVIIKEYTPAPTLVFNNVFWNSTEKKLYYNLTVENPAKENYTSVKIYYQNKSLGDIEILLGDQVLNASTINLAAEDLDNDNYTEKWTWYYNLTANTNYNFFVRGTRYFEIEPTYSSNSIYHLKSITISGSSLYMDNTSALNITDNPIYVWIYSVKYNTLTKFTVTADENGTFSITIGYPTYRFESGIEIPARYYIWLNGTDEDGIAFQTPKFMLLVYPPPTYVPAPVAQPRPGFRIVVTQFTPGVPVKINVETSETGFTKIEINVKKSIISEEIVIRKAESVEKELSKIVKDYIEIETTKLADEDIENVTIEFKVEKTWLIENELSKENVALYRLEGDEWKKLDTEVVSEDDNYVYYKAISPGLSLFAIAGEKIEVKEEEKVEEVEEEKLPTNVTEEIKECPPCPPPTEWSECIEGKQYRTVYKCGPETNYECVPVREERACEVVTKPTVKEKKSIIQIIIEAIVNFFKRLFRIS